MIQNQENQLFINDVDAFTRYGIMMSDGFHSQLLAPAPMKDYIEGQSRLEHGKTILTTNARTDSRDVTLSFVVSGDTEQLFKQHLEAFYNLLYQGEISLYIRYTDDTLSDVFHLIYKKSTSYSINRKRNLCTISVKFEEPNVMNRE